MPPTTFSVDTEVPSTDLDEVLDFVYQYYVRPQPEFLRDARKWIVDNRSVLFFRAYDQQVRWWVDIYVKAQKPIQVEMQPSSDLVPQDALDQLKEDLVIAVELHKERVRRTTLYFAWVEGEKIIPETMPSARKRSADRLFGSNMLIMFVISIALSILVFAFLGEYAPAVLIGIQLVTVLLADRVVQRLGNWRIDSRNPYVHLLQYPLPRDQYAEFLSKFGPDVIGRIKREIYERTFALGVEPSCDFAEEVLAKYGMRCEPGRMVSKKLNVYDIVKRAADRFSLPTPKIVVSNTMLPNAAATGPSPSHATVLITTGLFAQLEEDEILNVVGHEMGHVKGRDPLWLFGLLSAEYLLRLYVFLPIFLLSPFIYFMVSMGIVYFIAKFFEARADLYSAVVMGQPQVLAEALRKIGYRRLQFERAPQSRVQAWLSPDPHPPIYFRIRRLEAMKTPVQVNHLLIQSAKDVFSGFRAAF